MLRLLLITSFLVGVFSVALFNPLLPTLGDYLLNDQQVKRYFFDETKAYTPGTCNSILFQTAQSGFASEIGLPITTTWREASLLTNATMTLIDTGVDGLASICGTRQKFVQTLGSTYDVCTDRFYLLSLGNTNWWNVIVYNHLMKHLELICSTGFDVYQNNLSCIRKGETTDGNQYKACFYKFNVTVNANPNKFCDATGTFIDCIKDFFTNECNPWVGWMQCELERVGFASDCLGLAC